MKQTLHILNVTPPDVSYEDTTSRYLIVADCGDNQVPFTFYYHSLTASSLEEATAWFERDTAILKTRVTLIGIDWQDSF